MKIWTAFGSAHSAHLVVVGKFKNATDAAGAREIIEDFVNGVWEDRYPDLASFIQKWKGRFDYLPYLGLSQPDFAMGIDRECGVELQGASLAVSSRSNQIGGIVKLMLLADAADVKVTGTLGP